MVETSSLIGLKIGNYNNATNVKGVLNILTMGYSERLVFFWILIQITSVKTCAHDKRTKREKERPERAVSSEPRATPWVSAYKRQRPVRAKVWANGWLLLLPLQGVVPGFT